MSDYIAPEIVYDAINDIKNPTERMEIYDYINTLITRIAELEAALHDMAKHVWRGDWNQLKPETRALLGDKK